MTRCTTETFSEFLTDIDEKSALKFAVIAKQFALIIVREMGFFLNTSDSGWQGSGLWETIFTNAMEDEHPFRCPQFGLIQVCIISCVAFDRAILLFKDSRIHINREIYDLYDLAYLRYI